MARKKKSYINRITTRDKNMLQAFKNVGYLDKKMLNDDLQQADNRINNFVRDNYLEKVSYLNKETKKAEIVYRLTEQGKKLSKSNLSFNNFYRSSSPNHDLKLAEIYLSMNQEIKDSWIVESEFREMMISYSEEIESPHNRWKIQDQLKRGKLSSLDGGYRTESGKIIGIEVVTSSYRQSDIDSKQSFASTLDIEYQESRA